MEDNFGVYLEGDSVEVKALKPGSQLHIKTLNSIYDIQIVNDSEISISGGLRRTGGLRFPVPTPALLVGATRGYFIKYGYVSCGMRMSIKIGHESVETSLITEMNITGPENTKNSISE